MIFRPLELLTGGLKFVPVVFLIVLQADGTWAQSAPAPGGGLPGAPTGLVVTALPCAFKLSFTPPNDGGSPILGYYAYDPKTPWISSWAGSAHVLKRSPILIQGGSGTHSFVVRAVNKNGVGPFSALSKTVTAPGTPPPATDPYWIYHDGSFNWEGDFSWPGGRTVPPAVPGVAIETDWFDESVPALSGPGCVGIVLPTPGNFAPVLGKTIDVVALGYKYWTVAIRPGYDKPNFTITFETVHDVVVTKKVPLNKYGTFTKGQWTTINIPISDFGMQGRPVYKMLLEAGEAGSWHVDNLGFCNKPQPTPHLPPAARGTSSTRSRPGTEKGATISVSSVKLDDFPITSLGETDYLGNPNLPAPNTAFVTAG